MNLKRPVEEYIQYDPFDGDKDSSEVRCAKVKIVKTRKEHQCFVEDHIIPIGSFARYENALYDGEWMTWYHCIDCIEEYLKEWEDE